MSGHVAPASAAEPTATPSWKPSLVAALSLVTCCLPLGLVGAFLGHRQWRAAKEAGQAAPLQSVLAMVRGIASLVPSSFLAYRYKQDREATAAQAARVQGAVKDARKQAMLDTPTACSLAELWFLQTQGIGEVKTKCPSQPVRDGTLEGVEFLRGTQVKRFNVCLARTESEWVVWGALASGRCPEAPQAKGEEAMRTAGKPLLEQVVVSAWSEQVRRMQAAMAAGDVPTACPTTLTGQAHVLDLALAEGAKDAEPWKFLSTSAFARALPLGPAVTAERAQPALEAMGNVVAVLVAAERALPRQVTKSTFDPGFFEGQLVLMDPRAGKALCASEVSFESSDSLGGGVKVGLRLGPKVTVGNESLQGNFEQNADQALAAAVKRLTGGAVTVDR